MHIEIATCSGCGRQCGRLRITREKNGFWFACKYCDGEFKKHLDSIDTQQEIDRLEDRLKTLKGKNE